MRTINTKIRAYICGPVTDIYQHNEPAFRLWEERLNMLGYEVVVPLDLEVNIDYSLENILRPADWKEYVWRMFMRSCLPAVCASQILITLPNWSESRGGKIEVRTARDIMIPVVHCVNVKHAEELQAELDEINKAIT